MPGSMFVMTGTSGAGKTTIAQHLLKRNPNLKKVVTHNSRPPREGEVEGVSYFFVSRETFEKMIENDEMLEWAHVYEDYKGVSKQAIQDVIKTGKDVLLVVDPQGAKTIKEQSPEAISFFLDAESDEILIGRLTGRGLDDEKTLEKRIKDIEFDRSHIPFLDHVIINEQGKLEDTLKKMESIMKSARNES